MALPQDQDFFGDDGQPRWALLTQGLDESYFTDDGAPRFGMLFDTEDQAARSAWIQSRIAEKKTDAMRSELAQRGVSAPSDPAALQKAYEDALAKEDPSNSKWFAFYNPLIQRYGLGPVKRAALAGELPSPTVFPDWGVNGRNDQSFWDNMMKEPDNGDDFQHFADFAAPFIAGTVVGGPAAGAALATGLNGGSVEDVARNAALAYAGGQLAQGVSGAVGGGAPGAVAGGAAAGGGTTILSGGDVGTGMLSGAISGGTSAAVGGGPVGDAVGRLAGAAATDQDMEQAAMQAALGLGMSTAADSLRPTPGYDLGGGLSVDANGNVAGGMFSSLGTDDIDYEVTPVDTYKPTPVNTDLGTGLRIGAGAPGVTVPTTDSLLSAPSGDLGITAAPGSPLGDPLSFINTGGTTLYTPPSFSLPPIGGEGLRAPSAPNLENMGGGQGLTAPTNAVLGDPNSIINSPAVLAAVQAGLINENGMLPLGTGAALGDPTSPINAGTFAQPGVETTPGAIAEAAAAQADTSATVEDDAAASEEPAPREEPTVPAGPVRATVMQSPQDAAASAQKPAAPAPAPKPQLPQRKFDDKKVETIVERLREAGIIPQVTKGTAPGAQRAMTATNARVDASDGVPGLPTPAGAPKREEGQTDQQYTEALVTYLNAVLAGLGGKGEGKDEGRGEGQGEGRGQDNVLAQLGIDLSAQRLADLGLTPGTPEYYEYLMSQLDEILSRIFNGLDPDDASFSGKIRAKTRGEMEALYRVLYVRGVLGQLMGSGKYLDAFTGIEEDVIAPEGRTFNPAMGAYHRGLARSFDELRGMSAADVRRRLGGMLDRNPDLFGMQASANARRIKEALAAMGYDPNSFSDPMKRRQRGMFSGIAKG